MPLSGAVVQLVAVGGTVQFGIVAISDSLGRFALTDVPNGRYTIGFFHPMLDSLGLEPTLREVRVEGKGTVRADLAIPSAARLRWAICAPQLAANAGGVVVGTVRNTSDGAAAAGVAVIGEWVEVSLSRDASVRRIKRLTAMTLDNGWFALCGVPRPGTLMLIATRGEDSTDRIEVQVPGDGFLRRDVYLGRARSVLLGYATQRADTLSPPRRRRMRVGDGRVSGVVVTVGGRPLPGARVAIPDGPYTRTNDRGEWALVDAPLGTRLLDVRAIGYYPHRLPIDVVAGAAPVRVVLSALVAVLDTVSVNADRQASGFEERRRSGVGRYLTPQDIRRRSPFFTSDLFRNMAGVKHEGGIRIRGPFGDCSPALYVNGRHIPTPGSLTADDIDLWARPDEIAGIEVYYESVPPQFQVALSGCGSIVIWTK